MSPVNREIELQQNEVAETSDRLKQLEQRVLLVERMLGSSNLDGIAAAVETTVQTPRTISMKNEIWPEFLKSLKKYNDVVRYKKLPITLPSDRLVDEYYSASQHANNRHGIQFKKAINKSSFFMSDNVFVRNSEIFRENRTFIGVHDYLREFYIARGFNVFN